MIEMIEKVPAKRGRPRGVKNQIKTVTLVLDKQTIASVQAHKGYLSDLYKINLTDEQTIQHILATALEGK